MIINDENREEIISEVVDGLISEMTLEDMRRDCWDRLYDDVICMDDFTLEHLASIHCPWVSD